MFKKNKAIREFEDLKFNMPNDEIEEAIWLNKALLYTEREFGRSSIHYSNFHNLKFRTKRVKASKYWKTPEIEPSPIQGSHQMAIGYIDACIYDIKSGHISKKSESYRITSKMIYDIPVGVIVTIIGGILLLIISQLEVIKKLIGIGAQ